MRRGDWLRHGARRNSLRMPVRHAATVPKVRRPPRPGTTTPCSETLCRWHTYGSLLSAMAVASSSARPMTSAKQADAPAARCRACPLKCKHRIELRRIDWRPAFTRLSSLLLVCGFCRRAAVGLAPAHPSSFAELCLVQLTVAGPPTRIDFASCNAQRRSRLLASRRRAVSDAENDRVGRSREGTRSECMHKGRRAICAIARHGTAYGSNP